MEKIIEISPAWDKRHPEPNKNYGIHGVEMRFVLKGPEGAVQFVLYTNWQLPHVQEELDRKEERDPRFKHSLCHPMPADLGYHSPVPRYEGQTQLRDSCHLLDDKPCFYDGSGLNAEPVYERLLREGDKGVWAALEEFYLSVFSSVTN